MLDVEVLGANRASEWNELVEKTPYSAPYHLWDWGEVLSSLYGYTRYYLAIPEKDKVIGAFPLTHVKSKLFGNRLISSPFCEYGGPISDPSFNDQKTSETLKSLLISASNLASSLNVEYIQVRQVLSKAAEDLLVQLGYVTMPRYVTFQVDLARDSDEIWACLHKNRTRKSIKKAVKSNVVTREVEDADELASYYSLYLKSVKKLGSPPHKYELFKRMYDVFNSKGKVKIRLAYYGGVPIGGLIVFCQGKTIFDWNSVTDHKFRSLNSHNLLLWNVIEWGVANGYRTLDLGRTRKGTSIYEFKSGWGGQETNLSEYIYFLDATKKKEPADAMQTKYRYLAKVWSHLPSGIAKKVGPKIIAGIAL